MFEKVTQAPADPILGLTEEFRNDPRTNKINLGVGIYKDEAGATPILNCVKKAEKILHIAKNQSMEQKSLWGNHLLSEYFTLDIDHLDFVRRPQHCVPFITEFVDKILA